MQSAIRRTPQVIRLDGSAVGSATTAVRIPLKKESLMADHLIRVQATQNFGSAGSVAIPTSCDPRNFIHDVSIETSDGRRVFATGYQVIDLSRFFEPGWTNPIFYAGTTSAVAATMDFDFIVHHANDGALHDMMAAIDASKLNTFDLVVNFNTDATNGFAVGGGVNGSGSTVAAAYTVTCRSLGYPDMVDYSKYPENEKWVESMRHVVESQQKASTAGAGTSFDLRLTSGNKTRALMLHAFDTSGTLPAPANTIINNVSLVINGQQIRQTTFPEVQKQNVRRRSFGTFNGTAALTGVLNSMVAIPGVAVIDFGDDEAGWLDLRGVNEPILTVDVGSQGSLPASYTIQLAQDYNIVMK